MSDTLDIYSVLDSVRAFPNHSSDYIERMMHQIPQAKVVDREKFILANCKGKRVLNLGSVSGRLHSLIKAVAVSVVGVDKERGADIVVDLDEQPERLEGEFDLVVAGEILEHLGNPGHLLKTLRRLSCPVLITVPNAHTSVGRAHLHDGVENVNRDHVAWYSHKTLETLISRYGFTVDSFYWYGGKPVFSEGLIMLVK